MSTRLCGLTEKGKLQEIRPKGIFAGWSLSFLKDSLGSGLFFVAFETVKSQAYLKFVTAYYGSLEPWGGSQSVAR
jgi:hypothetical protein